METEGAGGLTTTAIERCIDNWADETQDGAEIPAARAELAALLDRAGQVGPLRAALSGLLGGIDRDDRPHPGQSLCRGLHTLDMVDRAIAPVVADAGPGAAGARDETAALGRVARAARAVRHVTFYGDTGEVGFWGGDRFANRDALAELSAALDALDAPRAGGAGGG
jgi:hypothetical protein